MVSGAEPGMREQAERLRRRLQEQEALAQASGLLQERYELADLAAAERLIRQVAERYRLAPAALAAAVRASVRVSVHSGPSAAAVPGAPPPWPLARPLPPAPPLDLLPVAAPDTCSAEEVALALLDAALGVTGADRGSVQLFRHGRLDLVVHRGFDDAVQAVFAPVAVGGGDSVDGPGGSLQSTPVVSADGHCQGLVSTHSSQSAAAPTDRQLAVVDSLTAVAAAWFSWYRNCLLPAALGQLDVLGATARR
ncbi:hypothetical protein ACFQZC_09115 [Streptacidiphilus monticola]